MAGGPQAAALVNRRDFLTVLGGFTVTAAAVNALPAVLRSRRWWSVAFAGEPDVALDTFNGVAAMIWPGDDRYSVNQGEWNGRPGAVAANAGHHVMVALDSVVPAPGHEFPIRRGTVPLSGPIASVLNSVALTVNPAAANGTFVSPFAGLPYADKAAVWRRLELEARQATDGDPTQGLGVLQFVFGVLPALLLAFAFSEIDVLDPATRTLRHRPVGWDHCGYLGALHRPVEGWDEFRGYYQGRRQVEA